MPDVFVTGASGCVGHYVVDELSPEHNLYLLVRNPAKLRFDPGEKKNVTIVPGDLDDISSHSDLLSRMDYCIHIATAWGGEHTERINVHRGHELFSLMNPHRIKRVIYFSTASILGRGNRPLEEAEKLGTDYVRTKYRCYRKLPELPIYDKVVTVFPTMVFGGDAGHPFSHVTLSLPLMKRFWWLVGRLDVEGTFHFIHAQDIARIVKYLLEAPQVGRDYVMGNDPISFGEATKRIARYYGRGVSWQLHLSPERVLKLGALVGAKMAEWDRFCLEYKDFVYDTVSCPSLGLPSTHSTLEEILADWKLVVEEQKRSR